MNEFEPRSTSLLSRMLQSPVRLRIRSRIAALILALVSGLAGGGMLGSGAVPSVLTALVWLMVPIVAAGIGTGDAFFLRHGVGDRRVALTLIAGFVVALGSCVALAIINTDASERSLVSGLLYFVLVLGMVGVLSSGIAIALGKSESYLSRRIQDVDDTGW